MMERLEVERDGQTQSLSLPMPVDVTLVEVISPLASRLSCLPYLSSICQVETMLLSAFPDELPDTSDVERAELYRLMQNSNFVTARTAIEIIDGIAVPLFILSGLFFYCAVGVALSASNVMSNSLPDHGTVQWTLAYLVGGSSLLGGFLSLGAGAWTMGMVGRLFPRASSFLDGREHALWTTNVQNTLNKAISHGTESLPSPLQKFYLSISELNKSSPREGISSACLSVLGPADYLHMSRLSTKLLSMQNAGLLPGGYAVQDMTTEPVLARPVILEGETKELLGRVCEALSEISHRPSDIDKAVEPIRI